MCYDLQNVPDNLPPGEYDTRIVSVDFRPCGLHFVLDFRGLRDENDPSLIHFTKEEVKDGEEDSVRSSEDGIREADSAACRG